MITAKLTPDQFNSVAVKLRTEHGLDLSGPDGTLSKDGVQVDYHYDGTTLKIHVTHAPWPITTHHCEAKIADALTAAGVQDVQV